MDIDRFQATLIERNVRDDQTPQTVDDCALCDAPRSVAISIHFRVCTRKVKPSAALLTVDGDREANSAAVIHQVFGRDGRDRVETLTKAELAEHVTHGKLSILLDVEHVGLYINQRVFLD